MRKVLLALMLVSASFAGGAVINGPGLRWAQAQLLSRLNGDDDEAEADRAAARIEEIPSRPIPPLVIAPPAPATKPAPAPAPAPRPESPSGLPGLAPVPEGPSSGLPEAVAVAEVPPPLPIEPAQEQERDQVDRAIRKVSLTNQGEEAEAPEPVAPPSSEPADWAEVRDRLRALGVSRYGSEGEPSGRVRFYCVIPLAGRRAVGQHFEAEGDDDLQAARAALRRVALWKATDAGGAP